MAETDIDSSVNTVFEEQFEQQPTTQPAESGDPGEKLFTQKDVDEIVRRRLERERTKREKGPSETELREKELASRESALACREFLQENKLPAGLAQIVDTSDPQQFELKVRRVVGMIKVMAEDMAAELAASPRPVAPLRAEPGSGDYDMMTAGALANTPHTPRHVGERGRDRDF